MKKISLLFVVIIILFIVLKCDGMSYENANLVQSNNENEEATQTVAEEKNLDSLNGKTIACIGDSLIEGYGNEFKGIDDYLAEKLPNTHIINNSKSGSTITDNSGTDNIIILNQARTLSGNPDIIILDGGANDVMGYALGFLSNDLKKEIGTVDMNSNAISGGDTVIADFEEIIFELKYRFPNAKICYLQPFLIDDETISHLTSDQNQIAEIKSRRDSLFGQMQQICTKWQMEYLDVSNYFIGTGTTYRQEDWTHIKHEGYELLIPHILDKLKEM